MLRISITCLLLSILWNAGLPGCPCPQDSCPRVVRGTVHDARGEEPLAGATVILVEFPPMWILEFPWCFIHPLHRRAEQTDEAGQFSFRDVSAEARIELIACHEGYAPSALTIELSESGDSKREYSLSLGTGSVLRGRIIDRRSRKPIAGAKLVARLADLAESFRAANEILEEDRVAVSDEEGLYEIRCVPAGGIGVVAFAPGHAPARQVALSIKGNSSERARELDFELGLAASIHGVVTDEAGQPLADSCVLAVEEGRPQGLYKLVRTDAAGRFEIQGLELGEAYHLRPSNPSWIDARGVRTESGARDVRIQMQPTGGARGRVVDRNSGKAPQAFMATLVQVASPSEKPERVCYSVMIRSRAELQDAAGVFRVQGIRWEGDFAVLVEAPGYAPVLSAPFHGEVGRDIEVGEVALGDTGALAGRVLDREGRPIAGALVTVYCGVERLPDRLKRDLIELLGRKNHLQRAVTTTDDGGHFTIERLIPSRAAMRVEATGFALGKFAPIEIAKGGCTQLGAITLDPGCTLRGIAYDEKDAPLTDRSIRLSLLGDGKHRELEQFLIRLDSHGRFERKQLPEGRYEIRLRSPGGFSSCGGALLLGKCELKGGITTEVELFLK